jgi:DNA mismatch endonuclease, patch repair protein
MARVPRSRVASSLSTTPDRSALMSRVRQKGTAPELVVQQILHSLGIRFFANANGTPGSPDIVDVEHTRAIFVHGCYWHRHRGCPACTTPKRNIEFWTTKFASNVARDRRKERQLRHQGYRVMTVWECQTKHLKSLPRLRARLRRFFGVEDSDP